MVKKHKFGGSWTDDKLTRVEKHLSAYTKILNRTSYKFAYIDAFAGTGYRENSKSTNESQMDIFQSDELQDVETFSKGSASIALEIEPGFDKYIFIEKSKKHLGELEELKKKYPEKSDQIELHNDEANKFLIDLCDERNWEKHRAVVFLDPYGMQIKWETIQAIAKTKAIDLWYLFPLGVGINRLLRKDVADISKSWSGKLTSILGTTNWKKSFYSKSPQTAFFGNKTRTIKVADFEKIKQFFINRLKTEFEEVAQNPLVLYNSKNNPIYIYYVLLREIQKVRKLLLKLRKIFWKEANDVK